MDHDDFVLPAARAIVIAVSPDELAVFEHMGEAYLKNPGRFPSRRDRPGQVLGSGIDIVIGMVSPVALALATAAYNRLVDSTADAAVDAGGKLWKRLRRPSPPVAEYTDERLADLHRSTREEAIRLELSEEQATAVADALIEHLRRGD
ncbi:hypothetical protein [Lentzea sp. NPDC059081]|uniref:hypothetical protein n=1 Tax=Lentzea sp. NPDC059081 TaxID=3346719 RepID=UPI0036C69455